MAVRWAVRWAAVISLAMIASPSGVTAVEDLPIDRCHAEALRDPADVLARSEVRRAAYPESFEPRYCRAIALTALGRYREAAGEFDALTATAARDPQSAQRRRHLMIHAGRAWLLAGVYTQARRRFDGVLEDGESADILVDRAITYGEEGRHEAAVADLSRAIDLDGDNHEAYILRAVSHRALGRYDRAQSDLSHVLRIDPDDSDALFERGWVFHLRADDPSAIDDWRRVIAIEGADSPLAASARRNIARLTPGTDGGRDSHGS